jgi:hypothetical protein
MTRESEIWKKTLWGLAHPNYRSENDEKQLREENQREAASQKQKE